MKLDNFFLLFLPSIPSSLSAPIEPATSEFDSRGATKWVGVYMCPRHGWQPVDGECFYIVQNGITNVMPECFWNRLAINERLHSECYSFADPDTSDQMSFGPDIGVWCTVYIAPSCVGNGLQLEYPGTPDLGTTGAVLMGKGAGSIQKFSSFSCGLHECAQTNTCDSSIKTDHGDGPPSLGEERMPAMLAVEEERERLGQGHG